MEAAERRPRGRLHRRKGRRLHSSRQHLRRAVCGVLFFPDLRRYLRHHPVDRRSARDPGLVAATRSGAGCLVALPADTPA